MTGIGGAPSDQEDPRADLIWGTVPRLVEDAATRHGMTEALVDGAVRLPYERLASEVDRYGRGFVAAGVGARIVSRSGRPIAQSGCSPHSACSVPAPCSSR